MNTTEVSIPALLLCVQVLQGLQTLSASGFCFSRQSLIPSFSLLSTLKVKHNPDYNISNPSYIQYLSSTPDQHLTNLVSSIIFKIVWFHILKGYILPGSFTSQNSTSTGVLVQLTPNIDHLSNYLPKAQKCKFLSNTSTFITRNHYGIVKYSLKNATCSGGAACRAASAHVSCKYLVPTLSGIA